MTSLQIVWFFLLGVLFTGYALLDGFDLGVGFWSLFAKKDQDRQVMMASIGPFWDGNEVWLIMGGGAIFAAFPPVYASVFSGLYLALMLLLFALIARATALEFRNKLENRRWRSAWDLAFGLGSTLAALLFGVALGNILRGLPLDSQGNYTGTFFDLLNPYALLIGLVGFSMIATHGALYLTIKAEGELSARGRRWSTWSGSVYLLLFLVASVVTWTTQPALLSNFQSTPVLWLIPALALVSMVLLLVASLGHQPLRAFSCSCVAVASLWGITGASLFPNLVPARNGAELSLTLANSTSSPLALQVMLVIVLIGMPLVLTYTIWVYRRFRGKVTLQPGSGYQH
ncbi:MAG: cytochrome d ubiquinol oxidase subunit II [Bradymonadales bacterium]|nr:cytochrome d ubiquinol oxidase subunit II [Bradymonadales bacterium]